MLIINKYSQSQLKKSSIRHKPKIPNLTIKPLSSIENSTEASTCAFKSQEKNGHNGIFTPKPITNSKQVNGDAAWAPNSYSKKLPPSTKIQKKPNNKKILPNKVHINISLKASPIRSDFDVNFNNPSAINNKHSNKINIKKIDDAKINKILIIIKKSKYQ